MQTPEQKLARRAVKGVGPDTDLLGNPLSDEQKATMRETEARWAAMNADPALLAEAVDVIRRLESAYTSHLFNSKGDFYEPGREPEVIAARAFLSKLENRHE